MTDPFDVLRSHVRSVALLERPTTDTDDLIAEITGAGEPNVAPRSNVVAFRSPRRRRWLVASSALAIVAVGGAGVAAYMGMRPERPNAGVLCRAAETGISAIVIEPTSDPIGACGELWRRGDLPNVDGTGKIVEFPRLIACVGSNGPIEVVPVSTATACVDLGMADADVSAPDDPVVLLQAALSERINAGGCSPAKDVERLAQQVLLERSLTQWKVTVNAPDATCALVLVDEATSTVVVFEDPSPS